MTAFRAVVLEHFRRPRNRGPVAGATASIDGANPLCGDRIRLELRVEDETIVEAGFTADACAICIAAASVLTHGARGLALPDARQLDLAWMHRALDGEPPPGRMKCVALPLDTFHRAVAAAAQPRSEAAR